MLPSQQLLQANSVSQPIHMASEVIDFFLHLLRAGSSQQPHSNLDIFVHSPFLKALSEWITLDVVCCGCLQQAELRDLIERSGDGYTNMVVLRRSPRPLDVPPYVRVLEQKHISRPGDVNELRDGQSHAASSLPFCEQNGLHPGQVLLLGKRHWLAVCAALASVTKEIIQLWLLQTAFARGHVLVLLEIAQRRGQRERTRGRGRRR
mmetsp:Transcript_40686/g.79811  ORF Transcript_40686/g.79811 Transcript_40686/m.79811 type:complete len:206 (-) Transcript_40686:52-669(-)